MEQVRRRPSDRSRRDGAAKSRLSPREGTGRESEVVVVDAHGRIALRTSRERIDEALNRAMIASKDHG